MAPPRFYRLAAYFRQRFGGPVAKIPLDPGGTCPNRLGQAGGCVYCNPQGSGQGLAAQGLSLAQQWQRLMALRRGARAVAGRIAYLQAYTPTFRSPADFARLLDQVATLPGVSGLAVGARPDCLPDGHLELLAQQPYAERWLDLGLQSASNATLEHMGRGHTVESFVDASQRAARAGLKVCAHLMAGLPGQSPEEFLTSVELLNSLPVAGVKFHNTLVVAGSRLATWWRQGQYTPLTREAYVDLVVQALGRLRPQVVVHRLTADPAPGELLAPDWAAHKGQLLAEIDKRLCEDNLWQGQLAGAPHAPPAWFDPAHPLPEVLT